MFKLIKFLFILMFLLLVGIAGLLWMSVEPTPLVVENSSQQVEDADSVKELMRQISDSLKNRSTSQRIDLTQNQLSSLVGFAQRARKNFNGKVTISEAGTGFYATYKLPANPLGPYINLDILLLPADGIALEHVKVGTMAIPGQWAISMITTLTDWYTGSDIATQFIGQVENIAMTEQKMTISIRPIDDFLRELNTVKEGLSRAGDEELTLRTAFYLNYLNELEVGKKSSAQSLAKFIGPVFAQAQKRSNYDTAAKENEAAIMALAIYAGHYRFANFVGDVQPAANKLAMPKTPPVLAKRGDLNQHFIFSAGIKILSEQGLSIAIGEFKELMDRGNGGSGYSFVDLSADFAGVKFAQSATEPEKAQKIQALLANSTDEALFFPNIKGLPEGLNKAAFTKQFKKVDSPEYQTMVQEIHRRVDALAIHQ
ncbi:hypothetical protein [Paraglaciecola hydrolytica]|uniref:Uncharacterized protein n=1 Tax=Paraglaciecola hydrolytica TaxID=1799789 RepID=A0A136A4X9_9ALTE|nr:hypothetical protein [Paraglaciecola hydrolytica]KXI30266.1 hypothetical protein AX660_09795 [Paraglaciecola hydrolytica]